MSKFVIVLVLCVLAAILFAADQLTGFGFAAIGAFMVGSYDPTAPEKKHH